ncbi:murein transglycosylase A [Alsobacter soli]|nr:MltA domain-containing protein [Alsobacter soli]
MPAAPPAILPGPGGSSLEPLGFDEIPGWAADDHAAAYSTFLRTCRGVAERGAVLRPGTPAPGALVAVCRQALAEGEKGSSAARAFFENRFTAYRVRPASGEGFLTGYYEPEMEGSLVPTQAFAVPVLAKPDDLVSFPQGGVPGLDPALAAARKAGDVLEPYPDRAAIWNGALSGRGLELLYVRDEVELFLAQVQGSARVRLSDGSIRRLVYAGRNGRPYTSIGKVIVSEGHMTLDEMSLEKLKAWLRANPADARRIMRLNQSYVFFAFGEGMDPGAGPIGAASVPLTPLRSIAVDRTLWSYGLPFWIDADLTSATGKPFAQLMIAQDTGSAILGAARADIFFGSGAAAGTQAGLVRHAGRFVVLLPREGAP